MAPTARLALLNVAAWLAIAALFSQVAAKKADVAQFDVRGGEASRGAYPYQVAVVPYSNPEDLRVCGGSLVSSQWVLSSAACVNACPAGPATASPAAPAAPTAPLAAPHAPHTESRTGSARSAHARDSVAPTAATTASAWGLTEPTAEPVVSAHCNDFIRVILNAEYLSHEEPQQIWTLVENVFLHLDPQSDIALLRLIAPVALTEQIRPIALVSASNANTGDVEMNVTGWGSAGNSNLKELYLTSAAVTRYTDLLCEVFFYLVGFESYNFCGYQASCAADAGGSPVIVHDGDSLVQVAITSGSGAYDKQCDRFRPTLFVNLEPFVDWIRQIAEI